MSGERMIPIGEIPNKVTVTPTQRNISLYADGAVNSVRFLVEVHDFTIKEPDAVEDGYVRAMTERSGLEKVLTRESTAELAERVGRGYYYRFTETKSLKQAYVIIDMYIKDLEDIGSREDEVRNVINRCKSARNRWIKMLRVAGAEGDEEAKELATTETGFRAIFDRYRSVK